MSKAPVTYSYTEAEQALARVHFIRDENFAAFRARLGNLKRLGVLPSSGGRGKRLTLSEENVWQMAFCLELAEYGVDPAAIAHALAIWGTKLAQVFKKAKTPGSDGEIYLAFAADFLANPPAAEGDDENQPTRFFQVYTANKLAKFIAANELQKWVGPRVGLINVSLLMRNLDLALPTQNPDAAGAKEKAEAGAQ